MKPLIRQMKGPGMNEGMKKPRKIPALPKPIPIPRVPQEEPSSYIPQSQMQQPSMPQSQFKNGGKVQAMSYGKGSKVISCQNY